MAKYYGTVGFAVQSVSNGVVTDDYVERTYCGDLLKNHRRLQVADKLTDNISLSNQISIVSDPYASNNFHAIRYATFMGTKWKVTDVEVAYPRLILTLGDVYNE